MTQTWRAALWMLGAIFSFTMMAIAGRELGPRFDTFEIMMYRSLVGLIIVLAIASYAGTLNQLRTRKPALHFARNLVHFTGQNLWFYAVGLIPLAQVFALEFTTPIWVLLFAPLLLGERFTTIRGLAALMGFAGILIVTRPAFVEWHLATWAAAGCAIFFALTFIFTKRLTRTESITTIMFYLTAIQLFFGVATAAYDGDVAFPDMLDTGWLMIVALCGLLAHFSIVNALQLAPATIVVPMDFARLPIISTVAMLIYQEPLDLWVIVGALVIFGGNYLNIWTETRKSA